RMQVPSTGLHREILLWSDRISYRSPLQCGADVEAPQFLECLVVISHHPTILKCREHHATRRVGGTRSYFNIGYRFGDDFVIDRVESCYRTIVEVAVVGPFLTILLVDAAVR